MTETTADIELAIPPRPEYVGVVRHLMGAVARLGQLPQELIDNAKLAGSEACTNAVTMSERAGSTDPVEVSAAFEADRLHIRVLDRGEYSEKDTVVTDQPASLDFSFERGLSVPLLQGLVDELEIVQREGGGNEVRLTLIREQEEES